MTSSDGVREELDSRLDRLERELRTLAGRVARAEGKGASAMSRISLVDWLRISGPTFTAMVFGFAILWNAQQVLWEAQQGTSAQVVEVARTLGRLEGSLDGVDRRLEALDVRIDRLGASVERLGERISELDAS